MATAASSWGYQLQGRNGNPLDVDALAAQPHDMLVIDPSRNGTNAGRFSEAEVTELKGDRSILAGLCLDRRGQ